MTEEQIAKLFQPFSQADTSTTRKFGGTGLGLTISRRLAVMLGGSVSIQTDITELKRAERELAEKETQLRVALDNMPGGMALVDRDLNYVLFNTRYSELYEFPDGLIEVGGSKLDELREWYTAKHVPLSLLNQRPPG